MAEGDIDLATETVGCSVCGGERSTRLYTERYSLCGATTELGINRCERCRMVYVSPRLTQESIVHVYELDAEHTISHSYCWDGSASERRFRPLLRRLEQLAGGGTLLDVGCGGGHFLKAAKKTGKWAPVGLEPVASVAEQAEAYAGCEVRRGMLEEASFGETRFDALSLLGVLEHVHDPVEVLSHARRLLRENGLLAVYVPNFDYLRVKDAGFLCYARSGRWSRLHPQEHLFHYTQKSMSRMLESCGFEVLRHDVGRPFVSGNPGVRLLKESAFLGVSALHRLTGFNAGGLEFVARKKPAASVPDPGQMRRGPAARSPRSAARKPDLAACASEPIAEQL